MKLTAVLCILLASTCIASASRTITVFNSGGYVIKVSVEYFDSATYDIVKWQSGGVSLGFSASYTVPTTALGISVSTNIDMVGFPQIFTDSWDTAADMEEKCTAYKVWGTIFNYPWAYTC